MLKQTLSLTFLLCFASLIQAEEFIQVDSSSEKKHRFSWLENFDLGGYGVINYYKYNWETLPNKRDAIDPQNLNLYLKYKFNDKIELKTEIEFEHGGTGTSMSFDPLEEFGEFEQEVEYGGAVSLEQMNVLFKIHKAFNLKIGKLKVYMGNASKLDRPIQYFTPYQSEVENSLLPLGWYETGIEMSGDIPLKGKDEFPILSYKVYLVSGLDNTGFSSLNWIKSGNQTRFEMPNANSPAVAGRLDYIFTKNSEVGFSIYANNASPNRPKDDFKTSSWVVYGDAHFTYMKHPWRLTSLAMFGHIQNSESLSAANRNLSNNLNVKRTPVSKMAAGAYIEAGYDILSISKKSTQQELYPFIRLEWYDSMLKTQGKIFDNPRYARQVYSAGINYLPIKQIVIKSSYAYRLLGSKQKENTFALGIGFSF
ncbi:MAG: hypothetical protein LC105_03115 [Chitinophagales bacterium]|nr:hypothetical protein [Chitinophagales bacterium]MCZ2392830.1 hypothetical protein [Chitinophagales bacterium]